MSERGDSDFLRDIRESMERIVRYTRGMEYEDFFEDDKTRDAVVRNLEIMGEATKALSDEFRNNTELRQRSIYPNASPFIKDGFVGDFWTVRRPISKLTLELQATLDLNFSDPELRVYAMHSFDDFEEERMRIGTPKVAPKLWEIRTDDASDLWSCRVTLPHPQIARTYTLLARPPEM
uniref:Uncharacterized protein n=1 Tax=Candidatus Kentrum sp. MB TaxID=2138164 RepID=A0A451BEC6_9GAMM|nr:MAG: Protein of unknown function DUF86 [Candidatus Kentron sp. MB]VFK34280.1 MAG: Protein of unknown function DUF86 [Candidatus Kentron sp. MB]VFK76634.1 MAG: Protein of unknown function DUF86 [Candidatus Kentron sp. MB]